jgi:multidrug efflux pump subunit AcrA (membrane-fusion protein)
MKPIALTLLAVLAIAAAAFGGYTLLNDGAGEDGRPIVTATVQRTTLREVIATRGTVEFAVSDTLLGAVAGRVTNVAAATGDIVAAGSPLLSVNGRPLVAANGDFPYWRTLRFGDEGLDVRQLEEMLLRDGFEPGDVDESFTRATERALEEWQEARGFPVDGILRETDLLVAVWPARVGVVLVKVGDFVSPGMPLVQLTETEFTLSLELAPTELLRVQAGLAVEIEVTGNRATGTGILGEPELVTVVPPFPGAEVESAYFANVALEASLDVVDGANVKATIVIREIVDAVVVPLAAVILDERGLPAVQVQEADGTVRLVSVVTGFGQGSLIEIISGLAGGEVVILETGS